MIYKVFCSVSRKGRGWGRGFLSSNVSSGIFSGSIFLRRIFWGPFFSRGKNFSRGVSGGIFPRTLHDVSMMAVVVGKYAI